MTEKSAERNPPSKHIPKGLVTKHINQIIRLDPVSLALQNSETSSGDAAVAVTTRARLFQAALGEDHNISVLDPAANLCSYFQKVLKESLSVLYDISWSMVCWLAFCHLDTC